MLDPAKQIVLATPEQPAFSKQIVLAAPEQPVPTKQIALATPEQPVPAKQTVLAVCRDAALLLGPRPSEVWAEASAAVVASELPVSMSSRLWPHWDLRCPQRLSWRSYRSTCSKIC